MVRSIGNVIKTAIATIGVFGFLMSFLGFLNTTRGYHLPSPTWDPLILLIGSLGVTGVVTTIVAWKYSPQNMFFHISGALLITDFAHWSIQPMWLGNHQKSLVELLALSGGFVVALVLAAVMNKVLVVPLTAPTQKRTERISVFRRSGGNSLVKTLFQLLFGILGSVLICAALPALTLYAHPLFLIAGIAFLISYLVTKLTKYHAALGMFFGFLCGFMLLQLIALRISPGHPLSEFIWMLPPFSVVGSLGLGSMLGLQCGKYLIRQGKQSVH